MRGTTRLGLIVLVMAASLPAGADEPDRDGDGYPDHSDRCPDLPAMHGVKGRHKGCPATAKFIGFSVATNGASTVLLHFSDAVTLEVTESRGGVSFLLKGAWVFENDSWSPPPGSGSALQQARLFRDALGVRLALQLKPQVDIGHRLSPQSDGAVLEVEIPTPPGPDR